MSSSSPISLVGDRRALDFFLEMKVWHFCQTHTLLLLYARVEETKKFSNALSSMTNELQPMTAWPALGFEHHTKSRSHRHHLGHKPRKSVSANDLWCHNISKLRHAKMCAQPRTRMVLTPSGVDDGFGFSFVGEEWTGVTTYLPILVMLLLEKKSLFQGAAILQVLVVVSAFSLSTITPYWLCSSLLLP